MNESFIYSGRYLMLKSCYSGQTIIQSNMLDIFNSSIKIIFNTLGVFLDGYIYERTFVKWNNLTMENLWLKRVLIFNFLFLH